MNINENTDTLSPDAHISVAPLSEKGATSLIDLIKAEHQELADKKDVTIPVIGYEKSGLAIKYRMPEGVKEIELIGEKIERETKDTSARNLYMAMDTLIKLCEGFYVKPQDVTEYVLLDPTDVGEPVRFDARMATIVGLPEESPARLIVRKLFGNHELAILNHTEKLSRWLNNTNADLTLELWQMGN